MARGPRDYAAEYARRVTREQARAREEGREPSLHKARGHRSREYEAVQRQLRRHIEEKNPRYDSRGEIIRRAYQNGKAPSTRGMIDRYGLEHLQEQLRLAEQTARAYESGDRDRAVLLYMQRDQSLPEWIWWYHGVFG